MKKLPFTIPGVAIALRNVFDPETGFNIVDMGLLYGLEIETTSVIVTLTYSSPACPLGEVIEEDIRIQLKEIFGVTDIQLRIIFEPKWNPEMMSKIARESV